MNNIISEDNFLYYFTLFTKDYSLIQSLDKIKDLIDHNKNTYNSIEKNYIPLFVYYSIKDKVNKNDFKELINHIYNDYYHISNLSFYRFFEDSSDITTWHYIKEYRNKNKEHHSVFQDMHFTFFDIDSDNNPILYDKNIEYLKIILNEVTFESIETIHNNSFYKFIIRLMFDENHIQSIFDIFSKHPVHRFSKKEDTVFNSFQSSLEKFFLNFQFIIFEDKEKTENFQNRWKTLISKSTHFNEFFEDNIIVNTKKSKNDLSHSYIQQTINRDFIPYIEYYGLNKFFQILKKGYETNINNLEIQKTDEKTIISAKINIAQELLNSFESLQIKIDSNFDINIDIKKDFLENWYDILLYRKLILQGNSNLLSSEQIDYLLSNISDFDNPNAKLSISKYSNIFSIQYQFENTNTPFSTLLLHQKIMLDVNSSNSKKTNKIKI